MTRRREQSGVTLIEVLIAVTLLSLLSVGMLFAMRVGLNAMSRTSNRVTDNRRVLGVERILTQQIAGFVPADALCFAPPEVPRARVSFFQGDVQTMRFVSTYSLQEASRGYSQILEFQVIPGENGRGVRLVVNEHLYTGPLGAGNFCTGFAADPATGVPAIMWRPVVAGPNSFVLADKLAACRFAYKEENPAPQAPDFWRSRWVRDTTPAAVRIDMVPLEPDPARLQVPPVVAEFRPTRNPLTEVTLD
jgi:prepilin-type N-terminal cleavage/methylation domain-containing protein